MTIQCPCWHWNVNLIQPDEWRRIIRYLVFDKRVNALLNVVLTVNISGARTYLLDLTDDDSDYVILLVFTASVATGCGS